jgi:alpha-mannosidase
MQVEPHEGSLPARHSFISVSPLNVVLTAVKKAEDSNALLFRVYESSGKQAEVTLHVPPGGSSVTATNLMEHPESDDKVALKGDQVTFTVHPWEIQTIRVNYSPSEPTRTAQVP